MILVSYDGSADAQAAIDHAARVLPGAEVMVLTVWEPYLDMLTRTGSYGLGMASGGMYADSEQMDDHSRKSALEHADDGVARATDAGLVAVPRCEKRDGDVANTVLLVAAEVDAAMIVLGTRGRGGISSFLLGSVSHQVVQHADRPVMVVPSAATALHRREDLRRHVVHA
jgi:nucleotide-binding universal stress UspA family protein